MKYVRGKVGELARSFRKQLGKLVHDDEGNINEHPPPKYASIISMDEWTEFVSMRTCEEFQRLSEENRARASNYAHKYRKSRLGYAQLEQNMLRKIGPNATYVPRHELWRAARLHNSGNVMDENVQQVWEECVSVSQSVSQGERRLEPNEDILLKALKDPEHPGRVRAIGYDNPLYHLVGRGSVYNQLGETLHNRPLPAEHVRVGVEIVLEGNAPLSVPNEDARLIILDDALGAHVAWPIGLIDLKIKCPVQDNGSDCGYYVLRFKREILLCSEEGVIPHESTSLPTGPKNTLLNK
ncbi:putative transposase, Ptta/En/Spm, plant [Sesbania bispinosa]|nr:putative transposase, Ptta/En/Spm, plant [Sesbania bispinosa]